MTGFAVTGLFREFTDSSAPINRTWARAIGWRRYAGAVRRTAVARDTAKVRVSRRRA